MKSPLRVGLLLDSLILPIWAAESIRDILKDPCAKLELIICNGLAEPEPVSSNGFSRKLLRLISGRYPLKRLGYIIYQKWDSTRVILTPDPFQRIDMSEELRDIARLDLIPITHGLFYRFHEHDLQLIRRSELDVLLRFGFKILKGPILESAKYGIWSYHHGDNRYFRGGFPYFWELYYNSPVNGAILQILNEQLDSGKVLYRSYSGTRSEISVRQNSFDPYWQVSSFVIRRLRQLHQFGWNWMQKEIPSLHEDPELQGRLYKTPTNCEICYFMVTRILRHLYKRIMVTNKIECWYVAYRQAGVTSNYKVLPCSKGHYYADPFPVRYGGKDYIFFMDYRFDLQHGVISYVEVLPDLSTTKPRVALDSLYHLSYPFIFEDKGEIYMIPESSSQKTIELYHATHFPDRWELIKIMYKDIQAYDVTLLVRDGVYWFFASIVERGNADSDELFLFYSTTLEGAWVAHPKNPIISDVRRARPAGRIFERKGRMIRPSQDCSKSYGWAIQMNEIEVLSTTDYREHKIERIEPNWAPNLTGTHTYNYNERLEVIDGRVLISASQAGLSNS